MKLFFDTNILLDVLLKRDPFWEHAQILWSQIDSGHYVGAISVISLNNIYYLSKKILGSTKTYSFLDELTKLFEIVEQRFKCI